MLEITTSAPKCAARCTMTSARRRAVLDLPRASEHGTLHHCLQPCCGPHPPLRLSLCAATAAEGKISWRQDDERPKQLFRAAVSVPTARCSGYSHWGRSVNSTACHTQRLLPLPLPLPLHLPLGARDGAGASASAGSPLLVVHEQMTSRPLLLVM